MGFWTDTKEIIDPKMKFRFRVSIGSSESMHSGDDSNFVWWYAKRVDKPKLKFTTANEGELTINSLVADTKVLTYPRLTPITMTLVDPVKPNATSKLLSFLKAAGYNTGNFNYGDFRKAIGSVRIEQLGPDGETLEQWWLIEPVIIDIDFGGLDYSSDDLLEISLTIAYQSFSVDGPDGKPEIVKPDDIMEAAAYSQVFNC